MFTKRIFQSLRMQPSFRNGLHMNKPFVPRLKPLRNKSVFAFDHAQLHHPENMFGHEYCEVVVNLFKAFATDLNGKLALSVRELNALFRSIGERPSSELLQQFVQIADRDNNGVIDLEEFMDAYDKVLFHSPPGDVKDLDQLIDHFRTLDSDGDGYLSTNDLEGLLSTFGSEITAQEAQEIIDAADQDGNGKLDVQEFVELFWNSELSGLCFRLRSSFRVVIVSGGPGCGKGTFCDNLLQDGKIYHLSSGDMLREEIQAGTPLGQEVKEIMSNGLLVDSSIITALLKQRMAYHPGCYVALDGFPRSRTNVDDFIKQCGKPDLVIHLDCPEDVMLERMIERGKTSGRLDDDEETGRKRLKVFKEQGLPTLEHLETLGTPIIRLDATKHPDEIWEDFIAHSTENAFVRRASKNPVIVT